MLQDYRFDFNGNGVLEETERRDLALTAHPTVGVLIYDISERRNPNLIGRIGLPNPAVALHVDRESRLLYASAAVEGVYVIDFNLVPDNTLLDEDLDGVDDRILETC